MDIKELGRPLTSDEVEFRVQSINKGGYATLLVYKNARADMQRLDEVVGPLNWQRRHTGANHNCIVSVFNEATNQWVDKEDTGTESSADSLKGLASDSFKRACFNWGIGRELYSYPPLSVKLEAHEWEMFNDKPKQTWKLKLKEWRWRVDFDADNSVAFVAAKDETGSMRYKWGEPIAD
jgi:hypothetical protein